MSFKIVIDSDFKFLIPPLLPDEFKQLESNIRRDGCQEPLTVWNDVLIDGHNRYKICQKHGIKYQVAKIEFESRDHAMAWIDERQLGRRNLDDDKRAMVAQDLVEQRSKIAREERARVAGQTGGRNHPKKEVSLPPKSVGKLKRKTKTKRNHHQNETVRVVARELSIPNRKLRSAAEIKKADKQVASMVLTGTVKLTEAKKLVALPDVVRKGAVAAVNNGTDVRTAIRDAKKQDYNTRIEAAKPKTLEGTYRIIYADPPWKYHGLNQVDEYGHAEAHYDCLDDDQLIEFKPDGNRLVRELADKNAVLFMWVTAPLLERCFPIIKAWGFKYKTQFVWDKIAHVMGHYNSVRHENLLIATKGSCTPDIKKLFDSVQSIERGGTPKSLPN